MISLTGGPEGLRPRGLPRSRRRRTGGEPSCSSPAGLAANRHTVYRLGPPSPVTSRAFNRAVIRLRTNRDRPAAVPRRQRDHAGGSGCRSLTLHTTGDGQVPDRAGAASSSAGWTPPDAAGCSCSACSATRATAGSRAPSGRRASRRSSGGSSTACRPPGNDVLAPAPGRPPPAVRAEPAARHAGGRRGPGRAAPRRAARQAHARRRAVRRPVPRRGGASERRARHAVPADAAAGPPRPLRDHGDGRRRRRAAAACRARGSRCGPSRATGSSTAARDPAVATRAARRARRRLVLERPRPTGPCRRGRSSPARSSRPAGRQLPGGTRVEAYVGAHALRRDLGAAHRQLLRLQPRRRRARTRSRAARAAATITLPRRTAGRRRTPP